MKNLPTYLTGFNAVLAKYRAKTMMSVIEQLSIHRHRALDIGAGEGAMSGYLISAFQEVTLLEADHRYESFLSRYKDKAKIVLEPFEQWICSQEFDFIMVGGVLEHVTDPQLFLRAALKLLASKGVMLVTVPNANSLHRLIALADKRIETTNELEQHDFEAGHQRYYDPSSFLNELNNATNPLRFTSPAIWGYMLKPFPNNMMLERNFDFDWLYQQGILHAQNAAEIYGYIQRL